MICIIFVLQMLIIHLKNVASPLLNIIEDYRAWMANIFHLILFTLQYGNNDQFSLRQLIKTYT
jgi:tRNA A37 threonylcarbamoyladenosine biosynthesis protein TsaE